MKQIIFGLMIFSILLIGGVVAEESNTSSITDIDEQPWMLNNESATAMIELYTEDLRMIEDGYGALILNDISEIDDFKEYALDPNGTIDALLVTIETNTNQNEEASAEMVKLYDAYDAVNESGHQMLSSFETNGLPIKEEIIAYKDASISLTQVFDEIIASYIDKNTIDEKSFRLLLFSDLLNAVDLEEGFVLTSDPDLQNLYAEKMASFDANVELFESRFSDVSIDNIKDLKQKADDVVQETIINITENDGETDTSALIPVVIEIMNEYHQISTV